MRTLLKRAIGATSVCALAVGMVLGANAFTKNEDFSAVKETKAETMVTFRYEAPSTDPYTEASVQDVANWKEAADQCPISGDEAPCSIQVPLSKVVGTPGQPGLSATINPSVNIETEQSSPSTPDQHIVTTSSNSDYSNEVNRSLN